MHRVEAGDRVTAGCLEREHFDCADKMLRTQTRLSAPDVRLSQHGLIQIQADGQHPADARGGQGLTDRFQVPARTRADVQEPQRSPSVRGTSQHRTDDAHGIGVQLTRPSIARGYVSEVLAKLCRSVASHPRLGGGEGIDRQTGDVWHSTSSWADPNPAGFPYHRSIVLRRNRHHQCTGGGLSTDHTPGGSTAVETPNSPRAQWNSTWAKMSEANSPAPNRATPLSGAEISSRNGMRHPLRIIVGTATAPKLSTMTQPERTR